ncbi:MAG TPA: acetylglutamate kinase [Gemmatimonadales bacterium]|jgi:acetylglutamate kinase|nr:acetylglutamate kinase [Gemmatimonadales bacterium]
MLALRVVKVGGNELDRPAWVAELARALKGAAPAPVVVVHGGGQAVSAWSRRLNLPVEKRQGLRVTTPEIAEVVEMVLAGPVNRLLVGALRAAGIDAIGLSGVDGGLLSARPAGDGNGLGHVGEITQVRTSLLESLLLAGLTPVVAPVAPAADVAGVPLNVNADHAAAAVAAALRAEELLFVSDVPGVEVDGIAQPTLAATEIDAMIQQGVASDGMAAKLRSAALALGAGVRAVRIGDLDMFESVTAGTRLLAAPQATQLA